MDKHTYALLKYISIHTQIHMYINTICSQNHENNKHKFWDSGSGRGAMGCGGGSARIEKMSNILESV